MQTISKDVRLRISGQPFVDKLTKDNRLEAFGHKNMCLLKKRGMTFDVYWADYWACKLGYHPIEIWGNEFYSGIEVSNGV